MTLLVAKRSSFGNYVFNDTFGLELSSEGIRRTLLKKLEVDSNKSASFSGFKPRDFKLLDLSPDDFEAEVLDWWGFYYRKFGRLDIFSSTIVLVSHGDIHSLEIDFHGVRHYEIFDRLISGSFNPSSEFLITEDFSEERALAFLNQNKANGLNNSLLEYAVSKDNSFVSNL